MNTATKLTKQIPSKTGLLLSSEAAAVKTEMPGICNRKRHDETHHDSVKG